MEKEVRNLLASTTLAVRRLLEEEFARQIEGTFDIFPDGRVSEGPSEILTAEQCFIRDKIVASIERRRAKGESEEEAVYATMRECAFTFLNRLAAFKMMESRGLVQECVSRGAESSGFKEFTGLAPGLAMLPDKGYRLYLECLCDEIGREVGVLFNRNDSASLLWPARRTLEDVLEKLNDPALAAVWREDETIGWIYQYYNDPAERKRMRDESPAPRNSRELAVRNQFFTPRYVVEFLTDNTLGRLWYEMTKGRTQLATRCRYLIRHLSEIFLEPGEEPPRDSGNPQSAIPNSQSQEELLRAPVHLPHRPLKDPRTIRMIDPACGSMHFGLYTFDLFLVIYGESWEIAQPEHPLHAAAKASPDFAPFIAWLSAYWSHEEFVRQIPRLIIEHNIHGIDIDPRAAQIAGLALWLRAQKEWQGMGLSAMQRPTIRRSNIVCAEPMPGDTERLKEFCASLHQPVIGQMLMAICEKMKLAGEAGSLLKIEEEIRELVHSTKLRWTDTFRFEKGQDELFARAEIVAVSRPKASVQPELPIDFSGVTDETFWEKAEERIYAALRAYAEQTEHGDSFQRRLFAEDAARGFAFIDLCRQRYDVALMNPPFGDASLPSRAYIEDTYGDTKGDVYKAFVECFHARLVPAGYLGIISSRTGFFLGQSEDWRTRVVLRLFRPIALADLGSGVLDAMVEVAAYVLRSLSVPEARDLTLSIVPVLEKVVRDSQDRFSLPKWQAARDGLKRHQAVAELENLEAHGFVQRSPGDIVRYTPLWHLVKKVTAPRQPDYPSLVCVRATAETEKARIISDAVSLPENPNRFDCRPTVFQSLPSAPFAYWLTPGLQKVFEKFPPFASNGRDVRQGLATADDFRFLRVWWEVTPSAICPPLAHPPDWSGSYCVREYRWFPICRGGTRQTFYRDLCAVIDWARHGEVVRAFSGSVVRNPDFYFRPGFSWPLRGITFSAQAIPAGSLFSVAGKLACADTKFELLPLLALANSEVCDRLITLFAGKVGGVQYEVGLLARIPTPPLDKDESARLSELAHRGWALRQRVDSVDASSHAFCEPSLLATPGSTLVERAAAWAARVRTSEETVAAIQAEIDDLAFRLYGLDAADRAALTSTLATEATADAEADAGEVEEAEAATADAPALAADLLAYSLGCAFGRWDIRYATGERPAPPAPDPFAALPVCPPGMLQNAAGLPAAPGDVPASYPVGIAWPGLLVDDPAHPEDIGRRVREVLAVLFADRADAIADEACALLGVKSLREWFRKPAGFFADHLKRYSKSRRQAPIYWPLSSPKGLYSIWVYYHRLTADTFFTILREFVKPKLEDEERHLFNLKQAAGPSPTPSQAREIGAAAELVEDLRAFRDDVQRVAPLWRPNLNDGAIINHAPLWRLAPHAPWRKALKETWEALAAGDYDWAHLALHLWPDRVIPKCANDRSLAIAHDLESFFWEKDPETDKWSARKRTENEVKALVADRSAPAVKAALESLRNAPTPGGGTAKRTRKTKSAAD